MSPAANAMSSVDSRTEAVVAVVLGSSAAEATTVVEVLLQADLLGHGTATVAAAAASRWGVELADALSAIAAGKALGATFSDYELRVAEQEGGMDLQDALEQLDDVAAVVSTQSKLFEAGLPPLAVVTASPYHVPIPHVIDGGHDGGK